MNINKLSDDPVFLKRMVLHQQQRINDLEEKLYAMEKDCKPAAPRLSDRNTIFKIIFGLTLGEARLLGCLMDKDVMQYEDAILAMYESRGEPPDSVNRIIKVYISHLRRKLRIHGVEIGTHWQIGYYLTSENRQKINILIKREKGKAHA